MMRFGRISRMISRYLAEVKGLGGVTQNRLVSPKGLYSNPRGEDAIVIPLLDGVSQDIVLAIQKPTGLGVGDVVLTDDRNTIHLKFDGREIVIKTKHLSIVSDKIDMKGDVSITGDVSMIGGVSMIGDVSIIGRLTNNGKDVGSTHVHKQKADGGKGGVETSPPS